MAGKLESSIGLSREAFPGGPTITDTTEVSMRILIAVVLVCAICLTASAQMTIASSKIVSILQPSLVPAVLDSTRSGADPMEAYYTRDGRFLVTMQGPKEAVKSCTLVKYDKEKSDPGFVDFIVEAFRGAFGEGTEPISWIQKALRAERPETKYYRDLEYNGAKLRLFYNAGKVPFQVQIDLKK